LVCHFSCYLSVPPFTSFIVFSILNMNCSPSFSRLHSLHILSYFLALLRAGCLSFINSSADLEELTFTACFLTLSNVLFQVFLCIAPLAWGELPMERSVFQFPCSPVVLQCLQKAWCRLGG